MYFSSKLINDLGNINSSTLDLEFPKDINLNEDSLKLLKDYFAFEKGDHSIKFPIIDSIQTIL